MRVHSEEDILNLGFPSGINTTTLRLLRGILHLQETSSKPTTVQNNREFDFDDETTLKNDHYLQTLKLRMSDDRSKTKQVFENDFQESGFKIASFGIESIPQALTTTFSSFSCYKPRVCATIHKRCDYIA